MMAHPSPLVAAVTRELKKYPQLDPRAVLAIAAHEGLGGGVGDNGTSFGPFQLHKGGALPAGIANPQQWAWSPQGIDYALNKISGVAGGLRGLPAITAISRKFERPANPGAEIQDAASKYGGQLGGGGSMAAPAQPAASAPAVAGPDARTVFARALLGAISPTGQLDNSGLIDALQARRQTLNSVPAPMPELSSPRPPQPAGGRGLALAAVPTAFDTRPGIEVDQQILPSVEQLAKRFGVKVNSGYRSPSHNAAVGGASGSDHLSGDAVDFTGSPAQMAALYQFAQGRFPYVEPMAQAKNHVHVSFRRR